MERCPSPASVLDRRNVRWSEATSGERPSECCCDSVTDPCSSACPMVFFFQLWVIWRKADWACTHVWFPILTATQYLQYSHECCGLPWLPAADLIISHAYHIHLDLQRCSSPLSATSVFTPAGGFPVLLMETMTWQRGLRVYNKTLIECLSLLIELMLPRLFFLSLSSVTWSLVK